MMLVKTRVGISSIHGMGLFAVENIPVATPIWRFHDGFDQEFTLDQLAQLPLTTREHVRWFGFMDKESGHWLLSGDHACFMNHAANPNTGTPQEAQSAIITVARRDIAAGEEITCDYFSFDAEASQKLGFSSI